MRTELEHEWSPSGAQRLGEWLREQRALATRADEPPDTAVLVRYCAGLLAQREAEAVEHSLTANFALRERWLRIDQTLRELQQLSLGDARAVSAGDDLRAQVAQIWLDLLSAQTGSLARLPHWRHWLQAAMAEETEATSEVFTLLSAVWHRWVALMRMPAFAIARSSERAQVLLAEGLPQDVQTIVDRFHITPEGTISLRVVLQQPDGSSATNVSGTPIAVALNLGGEIVPFAAGEIINGHYEVSVSLPFTPESLSEGGIPQSHLVVQLGDVSLSFGGQRVRIPLEWEGVSPAWCEIQGLPECVNGRIRMRVHLPDEVCQRYADYHLIVELHLTPAAWQKIGEWEISQWQHGGMEIIAEAPGLPDGVLPSTALVRMRLRKISECTTSP